jgi:hypothetical protein
LAAKYLQLIVPGLDVAIGHLEVAPWRAHCQEICIILVLRMQKNEQLKSKSPKKVIELDQLDQLKIRKNVNQNL